MIGKQIVIKAENIVTGYKNNKLAKKITDNFSFCINRNSITAIIGPNGSGKTTLLKTIAGIIKPVSGSVSYILDNNILNLNKTDAVTLAKARSIVLSKPPEAGMLTVFEIISMGRFPYTGWQGKLSDNDYLATKEALISTGIENLSERYFRTLSDGEKQKVMIARALAQDAPVILLDEPSAFLDLPSKIELSQLLVNISRKKNKTLIITTHDIDFALNNSDRLWVVDKKGTAHDGIPLELYENKIIENIFGVNIIR